MFPRLSSGEAADAFEIAELERKNLRIREVVFGGERQILADANISKSAPRERETSRYSEPEPSAPTTTTSSPNVEFGERSHPGDALWRWKEHLTLSLGQSRAGAPQIHRKNLHQRA